MRVPSLVQISFAWMAEFAEVTNKSPAHVVNGTTGLTCETVLQTECYSDTCSNGGSCYYDQSSGYVYCECGPGVTGQFCDIRIETSCFSDTCSNGGTCRSEDQFWRLGSLLSLFAWHNRTLLWHYITNILRYRYMWQWRQLLWIWGRCLLHVSTWADWWMVWNCVLRLLCECYNGGSCHHMDNGNAYCECPPYTTGEWCESLLQWTVTTMHVRMEELCHIVYGWKRLPVNVHHTKRESGVNHWAWVLWF